MFNGDSVSHYCGIMLISILDQDLELRCPKIAMKTQGGIEVPKAESGFSQTNLELVAKNCNANNLLYCDLGLDEFNRIKFCISAKEIWNKIMVTNKGTNPVKNTKISIYQRQCESLKMGTNISIKVMFRRLHKSSMILNFLRKEFTNEEKVWKLLSLPKPKWDPKVATLQRKFSVSQHYHSTM
jgi:LTR polyprotein gag-polypeptide-like protein